MTEILGAQNLSQGYRRRTVFESLDIVLRTGVTALLGPNGAGKTTLIRTLATIMPPRGGQLNFAGRSIDRKSELREYRRSLGYLAQNFGYYGGFSIQDFVSYCAWARGLPSARIPEYTSKALERVDLTYRKSSKMKTLSGGMLQRAGVASAIVGTPQVILLDEPTVGLDPAQRIQFRTMLKADLDRSAVLISTHLIEDVAAICDHVAIMHNGVIVFYDSVANLAAQWRGDPGEGNSVMESAYMAVLAQNRAA